MFPQLSFLSLLFLQQYQLCIYTLESNHHKRIDFVATMRSGDVGTRLEIALTYP